MSKVLVNRKRRLAEWRRGAPAVQLALAVACGQAIVWLAPDLVVMCCLIMSGFALAVARRSGIGGLASGVVLGLLTGYVALAPRSWTAPSKDFIVLGQVVESPRHPVPGETVFLLAVEDGASQKVFRCRAVELPWRNVSELEAGDLVWVRGELVPVSRPRNPFSWQAALWRRGIAGECRARFVSHALAKDPPSLEWLRAQIRTLVKERVGEAGGTGLFLSMGLGYHDLISVQVEHAFMKLGLTHLLVVSGYQVSLMFGFIAFLAHVVVTRISVFGRYSRTITTAVAFAAAGIYVVCIGLEMSAVRALLGAACVAAQMCSERNTSFAQRWGVALLGMLLMWPWCFFEIGVILTFAALFGIGLGARLSGTQKVVSFLAVNVAVWCTTTLVLLIWKGNLSLFALPVNLILAAPWSVVNCTIGLAGLCGLIMGIPGASSLLVLISWCNDWLASMVVSLADWSHSGWQLQGIPRILAAAALCMLLFYLSRRAAQRLSVP
jgi:ComEC/Rec2-related protein